MSFPQIPGYTSRPASSLADEWDEPADTPTDLWPSDFMASILRHPKDWVAVASGHYAPESHGGTAAVLTTVDGSEHALKEDSWSGRDLDRVLVRDDGRTDAGIHSEEDGDPFEFFCQVRSHHNGLRPPTLEVAHSFLWYWNAMPTPGGGWSYLDDAGDEHPLVRWSTSGDDHQVEVQATELRQYLHARGLVLLRQYDHVITSNTTEVPEMDAENRSEWVLGTWHCRSDRSLGDRPAFSRLLAKAVLTGQDNGTDPHSWRRDEEEHLDVQYGVDEATGKPLLHTSDPRQLGTYFDGDGSRLHHLTPVYFSRSVLAKYAREPDKYSVTAHRLSCLSLWGVDISLNNAELVEVYLGDIGERLPSQEWSHWKHHNVAPEGTMNEDRFRRDMLNQPRAVGTSSGTSVAHTALRSEQPGSSWANPCGAIRNRLTRCTSSASSAPRPPTRPP